MSRWPRSILITAGPTHEPIDEVRYIANRSSGRLGLALVSAAAARRIATTMLLGPVETPSPTYSRVNVQRFRTTADLDALLSQHFPAADLLIMAAAVADYRPVPGGESKIRRRDQPLTISLEPTPDLVGSLAGQRQSHQRIIGFALESEETLDEAARQKLQRKSLDAIVANPLATMNASEIAGRMILRSGKVIDPPKYPGPISKEDFAAWLIDAAITHLAPGDFDHTRASKTISRS